MKRAANKSNISIIRDYLDGVRPFTQVGYTPKQEKKRKEGEVWTDGDGKEWIQLGSTKISKVLHDTKEMTRQLCSSCKMDIYWGGTHLDEKFFNKTGKCYNCVIEEETKMRLDGTFEKYEQTKVIKSQKSFLEELKLKVEESLAWLKNKDNVLKYMNEDGSYDKWDDVSRDKFIEEAEQDLKNITQSIEDCSQSLSKLETQQ
jgi:hypothetical protein